MSYAYSTDDEGVGAMQKIASIISIRICHDCYALNVYDYVYNSNIRTYYNMHIYKVAVMVV